MLMTNSIVHQLQYLNYSQNNRAMPILNFAIFVAIYCRKLHLLYKSVCNIKNLLGLQSAIIGRFWFNATLQK